MFGSENKKNVNRQEWKPDQLLRTLYKIWRGIFAAFKVLLGAAVTVFLIVAICSFVFATILGDYLEDDILPQANLNLSDLALDMNSIIYYIDSNDEIQVQQKIDSSVNRDWANYEDIPEHMVNAAIAIEDHRFYRHQGVDWITTIQACARMFFGDSSVGGSSITQQLVKNTFGNPSVTVQRKVLEIFQATQMEKNYDKETILEYYLNVIYLGQSRWGVRSAAAAYYGKEVEKLNAAECASIIAITNSPTYFDPYQNRDNNIRRTKIILTAMRDQGWLTEEEYQVEINRELNLKWGIDFEDTMARCENETCGYKDVVSTLATSNGKYYCPHCQNEISVTKVSGGYNYHTETVIMDVVYDMIRRDKLEINGNNIRAYLEKVKRGGYSIYSTMDMDVQKQVDKIYSDLSQIPAYRGGAQLQSAIVVIDNETGDIAGIAGGVGPKTEIFGQNRATQSKRQSGSSIKPITIYSVGFETGAFSPATVLTDLPYIYYSDGAYYPRNSDKRFSYSRTVLHGVTSSANTIAVRGLELVNKDSKGYKVSYEYATEKFGLTTLIDGKDNNSAPLAMGAQTYGVTVREMATAFATFPNGGVYREARSYTKVFDSNGNEVMYNEQDSRKILSDKAVNYMNYCLVQAMQVGTGIEANLSNSYGITTAGKTGTTESNYDRWICGYTGYYTAAVWAGFDYPDTISTISGQSPANQLFKKVMGPLHKGKSNKALYSTKNMAQIEVCLESGKLATDACKADVRTVAGDLSRIYKVWVYQDDVPKESCDQHVMISYCSGGGVANEYCANFAAVDTTVVVSEQALVKLNPEQINAIKKADTRGLRDEYKTNNFVYSVDSKGNDLVFKGFKDDVHQSVAAPYVVCPVHTKEAWEEFVHSHPTGPDTPGTENGGEGIDPAP